MRQALAAAILVVAALGAHVEPQSASPQLRVGLARAGGGYDVVAMPLEPYVARVLAGEAARDSRPAALEVLAITIRTFALANPGRHRGNGFDLCDQTHCQVVRTATPATERAAQATAGRVLMHNGAPASVYYSASCGGRTEVPSGVWPGAVDPSYMPSRIDDACQGEPEWEAALSETDLLRALRAAGFRGDGLRELRILSRNGSGRVARLKVDGMTPDEISGQDLRMAVGRTLGWQHIKSTAFELRRQAATYRFGGHGSGHGVGLCVIGSTHLAEAGQSADVILAKYFPGLTIGPVGPRIVTATPVAPRAAAAPPPVRPASAALEVILSLPDEEEGERDAIRRAVAAALDELARTLGVQPPARVTLRVHRTTDDYQRATGQPWFAADAVQNGELHLLPLAVLRERAGLDRTIRHQLVHVMTDGVLAGRPAWVREGAATYFAGESPVAGRSVEPPTPRPFPTAPVAASCPRDIELLRPVSIGALSSAYARARACFVKQLTAGKNWKDVS